MAEETQQENHYKTKEQFTLDRFHAEIHAASNMGQFFSNFSSIVDGDVRDATKKALNRFVRDSVRRFNEGTDELDAERGVGE